MNKETVLMRQIMVALSESGCFVLRQNSGVFYDSKGHMVRIGFNGLSDLIAVDPDGIISFLEVKPDKKAHKRPEQIKFIDAMQKRGYRAGFVYSVDDAVNVALGKELPNGKEDTTDSDCNNACST